MTHTLYWMQCGGCSGDSMSLLNAESPDLPATLQALDIELLWHPSLSVAGPRGPAELLERIDAGDQPLDIFCVEGAILRGPGGTGMFDTFGGKPRKDLVWRLSHKARFVVAIGTCASFGGVCASSVETEGTGLQFRKADRGGFLGEEFKAASGLPVINLPGCPTHCEVVIGMLSAVAAGLTPELDPFQRPLQWYGTMVHQGCTRNEYHEFRVEDDELGGRGCLFFHMGCQGPLTHGPCNKLLWNRRSSKTRAGVPCHGCTSPDFPRPYAFFETRNIEGLPIDLPDGVRRAHYMVYKDMAKVATPQRLKDRKTLV